jgi:hypothetical protein
VHRAAQGAADFVHLATQRFAELGRPAPVRRKSIVHLGAKLHDLRLYGREPDWHFSELFHVLFENVDSSFEIGIGHWLVLLQEDCGFCAG